MTDLRAARAQIDALDAEILRLISERARVAQAIGRQKRTLGEVAFYRPERERQVLDRLIAQNAGPLSDGEIMRLFREIMSACLALEQALRVAYLGPEGTFTEAAAFKQFGHSIAAIPQNSLSEVFAAVASGHCDYGVVPVENSTEGTVALTLDLCARSELFICGEVSLRIRQNLLSHAREKAAITTVYAHPQALAQCRQWLAQNLPQAEQYPLASNAEAARRAQNEAQAAAIASTAAAARYQLPILAADIEDQSDNTTRFLVLGREEIAPSGADKTTIIAAAQNQPGLLYQLLEPIARHGVNMTRIESRPSRQGLWDYIFFIDLDGHQREPRLAALLAELREKARFVRVLGSYPRAKELP